MVVMIPPAHNKKCRSKSRPNKIRISFLVSQMMCVFFFFSSCLSSQCVLNIYIYPYRFAFIHFGFFRVACLNLVWRMDCLHLTHSLYVMCDWKASLTTISTWNMFMSMSIRGFMRFPCDNQYMCVCVRVRKALGWACSQKKGYETRVGWDLEMRKSMTTDRMCTVIRYIVCYLYHERDIYTWTYIYISSRLMSASCEIGRSY